MKGARSYYDVLVLGSEIPALSAGALLARRGFRVAWVRHDARPARYPWDALPLRRAQSTVSSQTLSAFNTREMQNYE